MKMKCFYLFSLILGLSFYSCSSDDNVYALGPTEHNKMQVVSFELPEFSQSISTRSTSDSSTYSLRYYVFYKDIQSFDVKPIKVKTFPNGTESVRDTLPLGEYDILIVASNSVNIDDNVEITIADYSSRELRLKNYQSDILLKRFYLSVGTDPIKQSISLERVVSKVELFIEDASNIPSDVSNLIIHSEGTAPSSYSFLTGYTYFASPVQEYISITREQLLGLGQGGVISFNILQSKNTIFDYGFNLVVTSPDRKYNRTIKKNIVIGANEVLKLSGKLFENKQENAIVLNPEWGSVVSEGFEAL